jgi:hypothetical protein
LIHVRLSLQEVTVVLWWLQRLPLQVGHSKKVLIR